MDEPIVRIVTIPPMKWVYFNAVGEAPELKAFEALSTWSEPRGLLKDPSRSFSFGRNNPPPSPEKAEYGYDWGVTVDPDYEVEADILSESLPGRSYAVVRTNITKIGEAWGFLYDWVRASEYTLAGPGMEELLTPIDESAPETMIFDLWLPVGDEED